MICNISCIINQFYYILYYIIASSYDVVNCVNLNSGICVDIIR